MRDWRQQPVDPAPRPPRRYSFDVLALFLFLPPAFRPLPHMISLACSALLYHERFVSTCWIPVRGLPGFAPRAPFPIRLPLHTTAPRAAPPSHAHAVPGSFSTSLL
eukprot:6185194-Pleurochrysis_carterae.AAC.1